MEAETRGRAFAAASSLGRDLGLQVDNVAVLHNSNALALRLQPCEVLARACVAGQEVAQFEVAIAQALGHVSAPIALPDPRVEPRVHHRDGFAVTFWTFHESMTESPDADAYAEALRDLHGAMRSVDVTAPHFTDRIAEAQALVTDPDRTPELDEAHRSLLVDTFRDVRAELSRTRYDEQLLHGEPHPGNVLATKRGPLFIDLETCCRGPIEFDLTHVPEEVSAHYPGVNPSMLQLCRRLVLAMITTWRWDRRDQYPNGRQHGRHLLSLLDAGPPWPAIGSLPAG